MGISAGEIRTTFGKQIITVLPNVRDPEGDQIQVTFVDVVNPFISYEMMKDFILPEGKDKGTVVDQMVSSILVEGYNA